MSWLVAIFAIPAIATDQNVNHGVILLYHHVSGETPASTSVTPEQFEAHLAMIAQEGFTVMPLQALLDGIYEQGPLPNNAVAITFDDAYRSVYTEAFPRLQARGWPFTVFVADHPVDRGYEPFMNWEQMRAMARAGVAFGAHSQNHDHLVRLQPNETQAQWRERITANLTANKQRLERELGVTVSSVAYPYGEFTEALSEIVAEMGLYGLGQQSGAVSPHLSRTAIPRFPMMFSMASLERLQLALKSRALPVSHVGAGPEIQDLGETADTFRFTLDDGPFNRHQLSCYHASGAALPVLVDQSRVTVKLSKFTVGRNKVNCTAPATDEPGSYFWYAHQWLVRQGDGQWPFEP